jgi:hypothetical protein
LNFVNFWFNTLRGKACEEGIEALRAMSDPT